MKEPPPQTDILLVTANARYSHTSLALRILYANLGRFKSASDILEFTIDERPADIVESLLSRHPRVVCLSIYIWNSELLTEVAFMLKQVSGEVTVIAGGPEVSFEVERHPIFNSVDHVIAGEGENALPQLLEAIFDGDTVPDRIIRSGPVDLSEVRLAYDLYSDDDIRHRVVYVEASRGCPFTCAFCLSALDKKVRKYPEEAIIHALSRLYDRGARQFKFIDRALHLGITRRLIDFLLEKNDASLFVHFELMPDHLPSKLFEKLRAFPSGCVQVEAGLQTLDDRVAKRIGRRHNIEKALATLSRLRQETGVHIHSDLVIGLPGESIELFEKGFDRLFSLDLHEIQVGILKKLHGAPIARFDDEWQMVYSRKPPYEILENRLIDFPSMQRLKRFAKYFDLVCNRGHFIGFVPLIIEGDTPFARLLHLSDWLYQKTGRTHAIALNRLAELLFEYVVTVRGIEKSTAADRLYADFKAAGRRSFPGAVDAYVTCRSKSKATHRKAALPERQQRHHRPTIQ